MRKESNSFCIGKSGRLLCGPGQKKAQTTKLISQLVEFEIWLKMDKILESYEKEYMMWRAS
jgi:hypothetical protein